MKSESKSIESVLKKAAVGQSDYSGVIDEDLKIIGEDLQVSLSVKRDSGKFSEEELRPLVIVYEDVMNEIFSRTRKKEQKLKGREFGIKVLFSVVDGRTIVDMKEIFEFFSYWSGDDHPTDVALVVMMESINNHKKPEWYVKTNAFINNMKNYVGDDVGRLESFIDDFCPDKTFTVIPRDV